MFKTTALDHVGNAYVDKNVGTSTPGTRLEADDRNIIQDELVNPVESSGQALDATGVKNNQVGRAMFLNGVGAQSMVDSGTANAKTLTPITGASGYVVGESYAQLTGAAFIFKNTTKNTGAVTINIGQTAGTLLGVKSLTQPGGAALIGSELLAGDYILVTYHLSNDRFELVMGSIIAESILTTQGDLIVRGVSIAERLAGVALGQVLRSGGVGAKPAWGKPSILDLKIKLEARTRGTGGDEVLSGFGFAPKLVIFFAVDTVGADKNASWGFDDGTTRLCIEFEQGLTGVAKVETHSVYIYKDGSNSIKGLISALGSDGFTITWTLAGARSVHYTYLAIG